MRILKRVAERASTSQVRIKDQLFERIDIEQGDDVDDHLKAVAGIYAEVSNRVKWEIEQVENGFNSKRSETKARDMVVELTGLLIDKQEK